MSNPIFLGNETIAAAVTWFLDTFLTPVVDAAKRYDKQQNDERNWRIAADEYRQSILRHHAIIRILGTSVDVPLDTIFTDVYIYQIPVKRVLHNFDALKRHLLEEQAVFRYHNNRRVDGMKLVAKGENLFILGKPGTGKTTFLKYVAQQAAQGHLKRLPIFVSLNEWANSRFLDYENPQLLPFIVHQFDVHKFQFATEFIEGILQSGKAVVLFDGLDEVRHADGQRRKAIQLIQEFSQKYDKSQHLITCRVAASDYIFRGFRDVEVAEFSEEQVHQYTKLWFRNKPKLHSKFVKELLTSSNSRIREICNNPLLLSMICLYFERVTQQFPLSRAELYEDAIKVLLTEWDATKEVQRDDMPVSPYSYRQLSPLRKRQMFAELAHITFEEGEYVFRQHDLARKISNYLDTLFDKDVNVEIEGSAILDAIESQHGILTERARNIYSFSHLTFHEYFTARYIVDHQKETVPSLLENRITNNRWHEVFLMTASLLDRSAADEFFCEMKIALNKIVDDEQLMRFLQWSDARTVEADSSKHYRPAVTLAYIFLGRVFARSRDLDSALKLALSLAESLEIASGTNLAMALGRAKERKLAISEALSLARELGGDRELAITVARDRLRAINGTLALVQTLGEELSHTVGLDYALYYAWSYAELFAQDWLPRKDSIVQKGMDAYRQYIRGIASLAEKAQIREVANELRSCNVPVPTASVEGWKKFRDILFQIMMMRNLAHQWTFSLEQLTKLNDFLYVSKLFVQCLSEAHVSNKAELLQTVLGLTD